MSCPVNSQDFRSGDLRKDKAHSAANVETLARDATRSLRRSLLPAGRGVAGRTVIDIGANKGVFSIYMSRAAGPDGMLIAFEAQPELGDHLRAVKQAFGLDNMTLVNQSQLSKRSSAGETS